MDVCNIHIYNARKRKTTAIAYMVLLPTFKQVHPHPHNTTHSLNRLGHLVFFFS